MSGGRHKWQSAYPTDQAATDAGAFTPARWNNDEHYIDGDITAVAAASVPTNPAAGSVKQFFTITGTTPNRHIVIGYLLEDGTQIIAVDITI
jgi:hypothetical protein